MTHSLGGLRTVLEGGDASWPLFVLSLAVTLALGALWFVVGSWLLERFAEAARDGSIDIDT